MEIADKSKLFVSTLLLLAAAAPSAQDTIDAGHDAAVLGQQVPVAEDTSASGEDYRDPEPSDEQQLFAQFERYKALLADGVLDEADSVAKSVVELAIRISGPNSNDVAKALINLAIVQHRTKQYDAAGQNFQTAVDIIEENEDRLNGLLVNPLKGLGATQLESGRPDLASNTFRRAVHVTHVNEGPHNIEQVTILESLAEANLRLGTPDVAKEIQDTIYALQLRRFGDNPLELVPPLMRRAAWQHRAGFIFDERTTYRRIIRIIEQVKGKDDLNLVEPLTSLGRSFFFVDLSGGHGTQQSTITSGEIYFKRAVRIAEENPDSGWEIMADTKLALGDYYMFEGIEQRARKTYQNVWDILSADEARLDYRHENLEQLFPLRERPIPPYAAEASAGNAQKSEEQVYQGTISMSFTISTRGRAIKVQIILAEPPEFEEMLTKVQRELRSRIYRPHFADGKPIISPQQILTHRFYYRQSDLDSLRGDETAVEESDAPDGSEDSEEPAEPGAPEA